MTDPQTIVDRWNEAHPVGTRVAYWNIPSEQHNPRYSRTRTPAQVLSGHTAVVWLEGEAGCWGLSHVTPIEEVADGAAANQG